MKLKKRLQQFLFTLAASSLLFVAFDNQTSAQEKPLSDSKSIAEIVNMPVVYKIAGMEKVLVNKDVIYKNLEASPALKMDVYFPNGLSKNEKRGAVILIHGGAGAENNPKNWGVFQSWGRLIAASGLIGVTFTHRLGFPKTRVAEAASDVEDAIKFIRDNSESFQVDKNRLCLAAFSAGGTLLSVAMCERKEYIRCLAAFYPLLDIRQSEPHPTSETRETLEEFSPLAYLTENNTDLPPIFIARAGRDATPNLNESINRFIESGIRNGSQIELMNHAEGLHGFDNLNDDERSREIISRAIDFLKENLNSEFSEKFSKP